MSDTPQDSSLILFPDLAPAFVGIVERFGLPPIACYDYDGVIALYMRDGMTRDEAEEFFNFNTIGAWVGERTPCFVRRMPLTQAEEEQE